MYTIRSGHLLLTSRYGFVAPMIPALSICAVLTHLTMFYISRVYCATWFEHDSKPASDYLIFSFVLGNTLNCAYFWANGDEISALIVTISCMSMTAGLFLWLWVKSCRTARETSFEMPCVAEVDLLGDSSTSPAADPAANVTVQVHTTPSETMPALRAADNSKASGAAGTSKALGGAGTSEAKGASSTVEASAGSASTAKGPGATGTAELINHEPLVPGKIRRRKLDHAERIGCSNECITASQTAPLGADTRVDQPCVIRLCLTIQGGQRQCEKETWSVHLGVRFPEAACCWSVAPSIIHWMREGYHELGSQLGLSWFRAQGPSLAACD